MNNIIIQKCRIWSLACVMSFFSVVHAGDKSVPDVVTKKLRTIGIESTQIEWIDALKLFEVVTPRGVLYIHESGEDFVLGAWYRLATDQPPINQTDIRKARRVNRAIKAEFALKDMVQYPAQGKEKEALYVFTDPNCPFCHKFHAQIAELAKAGVSVYYIPYPVIREESFQDAVNIWCANNRQSAMDRAKTGKTNAHKECSNPVQSGLELGRRLGISGTPYVVAANADIAFAGFVPTESLLDRLAIDHQ